MGDSKLEEEQEGDALIPPAAVKSGHRSQAESFDGAHADVEATVPNPREPRLAELSIQVLFRWCEQCQRQQPLRTKHCRICNCCVRTFDHHCACIANCVGERNRKTFLIALFLQVVEFAFYFNEACKATYGDRRVGGTFGRVLWEALGIVTLLHFLSMVALICLLWYQTYLLLNGLTTWEHLSWQRISYLDGMPAKRGSPFSKSAVLNVASFLCVPIGCPTLLRNCVSLKYDGEDGIIWETKKQHMTCRWMFLCYS